MNISAIYRLLVNGMNKATYKDAVSRLPCALGYLLGEDHGPVHLHHPREGQGLSQRASDWTIIPLCPSCHQGPNGVHGDRSLLRIAKVDEMDLLAVTNELLWKRGKR